MSRGAQSTANRLVAHTQTSPTDWDHAVAAGSGGLLQSWRWGEFKAATGWKAWRLSLASNNTNSATALHGQLLLRSAPKLPLPISVAYLPRGPIGLREASPIARKAFWAALHKGARRRGAIFLKVEPDIALGEGLTKANVDREMAAHGFHPSGRLQPARTIVLDIGKSEDALLKEMKPKTRYNIRLAGRRGVVVRRAETLDDLHTFYTLLGVTGERDEFGVHTFPYYEKLWSVFGPAPAGDNSALVLLAEHPDETQRAEGPIAGLLALRFGREAIYMYGASANHGREHMPNYLLQWQAIKWARQHGCTLYDFWGIPDAPAEDDGEGEKDQATGKEKEVSPVNTRSGLRGVYWFKKGFGGREIEYPGAYDYVYNPLLYRIWMRWRGANLG